MSSFFFGGGPSASTAANSGIGRSGFNIPAPPPAAPQPPAMNTYSTQSTFGVVPQNTTVNTALPISFSTHPFQYIQECLDPTLQNYRFRFFFYNVVQGGMIRNPPSRPAGVSEQLWTQTINDNPEPSKMVPVLANGFADLTARRSWQEDNQQAQRSKLAELEARIVNLLSRQDLDVTTQLQVIQKQQLRLTLRIMALMRRTEVLRKAGVKMSSHEQALMGRIQELWQRLQASPLGSANVKHLEGQLQSVLETGRLDPLASVRSCELTDGEAISALSSVLKRQREGLSTLIETINRDAKDLDTMRNGFS